MRFWSLRARYTRAGLIKVKNGFFCVAVTRGRTRKHTRIRRIRSGPGMIIQLQSKFLELLIKAGVLLNNTAILICTVKD